MAILKNKRTGITSALVWRWVLIKDDDDCWPWSGWRDKDGYGGVRIGYKSQRAHRIIWAYFNGDLKAGDCILHHCDNPPCCNPSHLFAGSQKDNRSDCVAKGRWPNQRGEANPRAKLTEEQVRAIRASSESQRRIAEAFGITPSTVSYIKSGKLWAGV